MFKNRINILLKEVKICRLGDDDSKRIYYKISYTVSYQLYK